MDNSASFIGDLMHPRHFSRAIRLCLHFGIEPVFIAPGKPWMNDKTKVSNDFDVGESLGNEYICLL